MTVRSWTNVSRKVTLTRRGFSRWAPRRCEMVEVLAGLTAVRILGDFSRWYESVALDSVQFVNRAGASLVPVCAQGAPDASKCSCD